MTDHSNEDSQSLWNFWFRICIKTILLLVLCNTIFAITTPNELLGKISLYHIIFNGRDRLPYGEQAAESYNLSLNNIPAMMASHNISITKQHKEYRVVVLGDSSTWGWLLENKDTLTSQLNQNELITADDHQVIFYNLGYPIMSLSKDLLLLDELLTHEPDMIIWPVSLESFARDQQMVHPIVQANPNRLRSLIASYDLQIDPESPEFIDPTIWQNTIFGQRRPLANLIRLQSYGLAWSSTGIDQVIPNANEIDLRANDFSEDISWHQFSKPTTLDQSDLAFDILEAGVQHAGNIPIIIINEPIYRGNGQNSDLHYNSFYPRWVYDQYRELLSTAADQNNWQYYDLWDTIPPAEFTDTPLHLTPKGTKSLAAEITDIVTPYLENTNE